MNRIEKVREYVDNILSHMEDESEKRLGYVHLYGVAQACSMLAMRRNENPELATISEMLHDIYTYKTLDSIDHAHKGAVMAKDILESINLFTVEEIELICHSIFCHSDKAVRNSSFDEVLKDADVMQHCLYNPLFKVAAHEKERFEVIKEELGLKNRNDFLEKNKVI